MKEKHSSVPLRAVLAVGKKSKPSRSCFFSLIAMAVGTVVSLVFPLYCKDFFVIIAGSGGHPTDQLVSDLVRILVVILGLHLLESELMWLAGVGDYQLQSSVDR